MASHVTQKMEELKSQINGYLVAVEKWMTDHYKSINEFCRQNDFATSTVHDWFRERKLPTKPNRERILLITGISFEQTTPVKASGFTTNAASVENRKVSTQEIEALANLIKACGTLTMDFLLRSTAEDRVKLREGSGKQAIEDYINGSRGIYSEKSRDQVLMETNQKRENNA